MLLPWALVPGACGEEGEGGWVLTCDRWEQRPLWRAVVSSASLPGLRTA